MQLLQNSNSLEALNIQSDPHNLAQITTAEFKDDQLETTEVSNSILLTPDTTKILTVDGTTNNRFGFTSVHLHQVNQAHLHLQLPDHLHHTSFDFSIKAVPLANQARLLHQRHKHHHPPFQPVNQQRHFGSSNACSKPFLHQPHQASLLRLHHLVSNKQAKCLSFNIPVSRSK